MGLGAELDRAGVVGFALGDEDRGADLIGERGPGVGAVDHVDGGVCGAGGVGVPDLGAVPVPIVGGLSDEEHAPGAVAEIAGGVDDVVEVGRARRVDGVGVVEGEDVGLGLGDGGPGVDIGGGGAGADIASEPLLELGVAGIRAGPGAVLDVDDVGGVHGESIEVVIHGGDVVVGVARDPVDHVLEVVVVVTLGSASEVVAVVVEDDEHGVVGVGVLVKVGVHDLVVEEGAVAASSVFVAFIACCGDGDDLGDRARVGIDVLRDVGLVSEGRGDLGGCPEVLKLDPGSSGGCGVGVELIGAVGTRDPRGVRVGVVQARAVEVDVVHEDPIEPGFDERGDHACGERGFGWEKPGGIRWGAELARSHALMERDLEDDGLLIDQGHEGMEVPEPDHLESWIPERCVVGGGKRGLFGGVGRGPVGPEPAVDPGGFERVEVLDEGSGEGDMRAEVREGGPGVDGVGRPVRVGTEALVVDIGDGEGEEGVGSEGVEVGDVAGLVHVPEEPDVDGFGGECAGAHRDHRGEGGVG